MRHTAEFGTMLKCALAFLVIALIAGIFGFTNVDIVAATIAQAVFGVFLLGFIIVVVVGFFLGSWTIRGPRP
jgi:uncharacterized membrane protein YtjA (UPF0391 family)